MTFRAILSRFYRGLNRLQITPILALDRTAIRRTAKNGAPQGPLKVASRGLCDVSCSFVIQAVPAGIRRNRACARSRRQRRRRLSSLQYREVRPLQRRPGTVANHAGGGG